MNFNYTNLGFVKVAAATPIVHVADCTANLNEMLELVTRAEQAGASVICFPELSLTGASCQDLFLQPILLRGAEDALDELTTHSYNTDAVIIAGLPVRVQGAIYNCAAVVYQGEILGLVAKTYLSQGESRWFASASQLAPGTTAYLAGQDVPIGGSQLFDAWSFRFGVEVGHDLWAPIPPSTRLCLGGAQFILCPCALSSQAGSNAYAQALVKQHSARCHAAYVLATNGTGESTQDVAWGSPSLIAEDGIVLAQGQSYAQESQLLISEIDVELIDARRTQYQAFRQCAEQEGREMELCHIDGIRLFEPGNHPFTRPLLQNPFVPSQSELPQRCQEIFDIQVHGLMHRLAHIHAQRMVVGISGGLDSTLALLVCVAAADRMNLPRTSVVGITMPGFGTTGRTYSNAMVMMQALGIEVREISIRQACLQHFADIGHSAEQHDVTYENSQARERTQILMDVANQCGALVVGTGDLSELALGWATYNGDHMSMYGVNASVPKTLVRHLVTWIAHQPAHQAISQVLMDVVDTPVSPELIPTDKDGQLVQQTEQLVGPYELHDFFLFHLQRNAFAPRKIFFLAQQAFAGQYSDKEMLHWLRTLCRRFFQQQFKRSCLPDGPRVGSCSLSPRGDWAMPSDALATLWMDDLDGIEHPKEENHIH